MRGAADIGADEEVLKKSGAFYSFGDIRLGQGREHSKHFLKEHPQLADKIEKPVPANPFPLPVCPAQPPVTAAKENKGEPELAAVVSADQTN